MPLESATYIADLTATNPDGLDQRSTADDHLRLIKAVLKATFPNANGAINATVAQMNYLVGVTSAIQTQLDSKLASASYTAADVLAKLLTVDGAASGLDADLLDGQSSAYYTDIVSRLGYTPLNAASYTAADVLAKLLTVDGTASGLDADLLDGQSSAYYTDIVSRLGYTPLNASSYTAADVLAKLLTVDGTASGLDADLLDGQSSAYYTDIVSRLGYTPLNASSYTAADVLAKLLTVDGAASGLDADLLDGQSSAYYLAASSYTAADVLAKLLTVDGAASGLDADLLDGQSSAYYQNADNLNAGTIPDARISSTWAYRSLLQDGGAAWVNGKCRVVTAGVTLDDADVTADYIYNLYNNSASSITLTQGTGVTLRKAGTATTGNLTINAYGMVTIWCRTGTEAIASGSIA